jgi:hypothetical protein
MAGVGKSQQFSDLVVVSTAANRNVRNAATLHGNEVLSRSSEFDLKTGVSIFRMDHEANVRNSDTTANVREVVTPDRRLTLGRFIWVTQTSVSRQFVKIVMKMYAKFVSRRS